MSYTPPPSKCTVCLKLLKTSEKYFNAIRREKDRCSLEQLQVWDALDLLSDSDITLPESGKICRTCSSHLRALKESKEKHKTLLEELEPGNLLKDKVTESKLPPPGQCSHCSSAEKPFVHSSSGLKNSKVALSSVVDQIRQQKGFQPLAPMKYKLCKKCVDRVDAFHKADASEKNSVAALKVYQLKRARRGASIQTEITPEAKKFKSDKDDLKKYPSHPTLTDDERNRFRNLVDMEIHNLIDNCGWKTTQTTSTTAISGLSQLDVGQFSKFILEKCPTLSLLFPIGNDGQPAVGQKEVMALSILGYSRNRRCNLIQKAIACDILKTTSKEKMVTLSDLGICTSKKTAYRITEGVKQENSDKLGLCKSKEKKSLAN